MKTDPTGASPIHRRPEAPAFRLRAEFPALTGAARHDFLVPNPRPDLTGSAPAARPQRQDRRPFIEPDSIFWCPETHAGDAA